MNVEKKTKLPVLCRDFGMLQKCILLACWQQAIVLPNPSQVLDCNPLLILNS